MKIALAYGTRPETLKFGPVADALRAKGAEVVVFDSVQSPDLTGSTPSGIIWNDGLVRGIAGCMTSFRDWLRAQQPQAVLVQGDTATAFACALAAFLEGVPVGHVEAGLRTYASEPFPEEALRRMIAPLARWHFCPDLRSEENIWNEIGRNNHAGTFVTGNPIIDTLGRRPLCVLATLHRRENWGGRIGDALLALNQFGREEGVCIRVVQHPNWSKAVSSLEGLSFLTLLDPMSHEDMLEEMELSDLIVTDSGGLQEEAAYLGVPCLVLRTSTERTALVANGAVKLIDPDRPEDLRQELDLMLARRHAYGAGDAGERIATILLEQLAERAEEEDVLA